ncbi:MAG: NADH-ubiquinone oxidoreductase subunit NDUFA12 family protein [Alphaproteobacteria bacterium]|nr:NADH-ubiquinone oxidoreductase subunit NDUFA12 family protein [Alphaproteobacteria bacterium]
MPPSESFSFVRRASQIGTLLRTFFCGKEIGRDAFGNRYYGGGGRRWVIYAGEPDPTKVPPEWHIWLHQTADAPLQGSAGQPWQKAHVRNRAGTAEAWAPAALAGGMRPKATGDYQAWKPE